jgi:prepilin-type N-terminal cleavage/methylation domain-containing protein
MKKLGFTVLELLIVCAIVGILAAVAIPAFSQYLNGSKTSEAKFNLDAIGKGSIKYFFSERTKNGKVITKEYPGGGTTPIGGMPYEGSEWNDGNSQVGVKHDPALYADLFKKSPWKDLSFSITQPFYYSYNYQGQAKDGKWRFVSTAGACLSKVCITNKQCDSGYLIVGGPKGTTSGIIDNSSFKVNEKCGKAMISDTKVDFDEY